MDQRIGKQGGWVGLIGMLVALAIVAWLYGDALKAYLLPLSQPTAGMKAGTPGERARAPGAVSAYDIDTSTTTAPPPAGIDRARGVEDTVKRAAEQRANQVDAGSR